MCEINMSESSGLLLGSLTHEREKRMFSYHSEKLRLLFLYYRRTCGHVPVSDTVKTSTYYFRLDRSLHESVPLRVRLIKFGTAYTED